jgi:ubiquinone/menaquinone biosynthesis C-methylase UbiE
MKDDQEQKEIKMIEQCIDLHDRNVLEIGCGEGRISALLAPNARTYVAIDPDPQRIRKASSAMPHVDFRIGTGEALEFEDASVHVVLFTLSLHHQKSRLALQEAHRVLIENGQLVILEPAIDGELQQFFHLFDDETNRLMKALNVIKSSDFEIEHQETFHTVMEFDNQDELCSYPFDRDHIRSEDRERIVQMLQQLQGPITDAQPIRLHDKIHIFSLRKT